MIGGTQDNSGETRVAILSNVTVTASVDTSFTFTVAGVASGASVNGDTTSTTTATAIGFGTLVPTVPVIAAQDLTVTTNAVNGFSVTVQEDQNLTSANGADIDLFKDGNENVAPTTWTSPTNTLGQEKTYSHLGISSEDATLTAGDEFGTSLYAGNFGSTTRQVFYHNGPANGSTANIGATRVGYKIEIASLQEAANDYINRITYVATPVF
ncbi:hypothetical protein EBR66_00710 [bacterium]|nr:hypothetical protein [bacterium]